MYQDTHKLKKYVSVSISINLKTRLFSLFTFRALSFETSVSETPYAGQFASIDSGDKTNLSCITPTDTAPHFVCLESYLFSYSEPIIVIEPGFTAVTKHPNVSRRKSCAPLNKYNVIHFRFTGLSLKLPLSFPNYNIFIPTILIRLSLSGCYQPFYQASRKK